ncbi:MAG: nitroreductase family protein [Chitinophagales bacterium]
MNSNQFTPYNRDTYEAEEMTQRSREFRNWLDKRRTVRTFSDKAVPKEVMENIIMSASSAPSGAHKQPWTFCVIGNAELKSTIRKAAEEEEYTNYHGRMSEEWLEDLQVFDTDWHKPFIEVAPWVIVVFRKIYDVDEEGNRKTNYYVTESVGIATGFLLTAIHQAGLVALTHTPSPMNFLGEILKRPKNEKPFLLIPVGYPAENTQVPDLKRKELEEVSMFFE